MESISELAHYGPRGSFYGQAVRIMILAEKIGLTTSRTRALWPAISSPLIHDLFISFCLNQPLFPCNVRSVRAIFGLQFGQDAGNMIFHCTLRDEKLLRHILVGGALCQ